jgi:hypothetical protein
LLALLFLNTCCTEFAALVRKYYALIVISSLVVWAGALLQLHLSAEWQDPWNALLLFIGLIMPLYVSKGSENLTAAYEIYVVLYAYKEGFKTRERLRRDMILHTVSLPGKVILHTEKVLLSKIWLFTVDPPV